MPKIFEFNGEEYELDDNISDQQALDFFAGLNKSKSQQSATPDESGILSRIGSAGRGAAMQTTQGLGALAALGGADTFDFIADYERNMPKPSREMAAFNRQETFSGAIKELFNDPETLPSLVVQGLTGSYPALAGGAAGALFANPITAAAGVGLGSLAAEAGTTLLDVMREEGVNVTDPKALREAFANQELRDRAIKKAALRGVPVAAFDAASVGFAGKLVGQAVKKGRGVLAAGLAEAGLQGGLGAGGEVAGSLAAGDPISPPSVLAEFAAEVATGAPEAVIGIASRRNQTPLESAGLPQTEDAAVDVDNILSGREPEQEEPAPTPQPPPPPEATTEIGGEVPSERQKEGQEILTPNAPEQATQTETPAPDAENLIQPPIERRSNTKESEGLFVWDYPVESEEGRADWAQWQVKRFKGNLREAVNQARTAQISESLKLPLLAEIEFQASKKLSKNPLDLEAQQILASTESLRRETSTATGQALQANKQANDRIQPYGALIAYVTGTRRKGIQSLPEGVRQTAEGFQQDQQLYNVDSVNEAANTMADEIRNKDC